MNKPIETYDVFYNRKIIINSSSPKIINYWITFLIVFTILIYFLFSFFKYQTYNTYQGIVSKEGDKYVVSSLIKSSEEYLYSDFKIIYKGKEIEIYDYTKIDEYYFNGEKYFEIKFYIKNVDGILFDSNTTYKIKTGNTTLKKQIVKRIRKEFKI